MAEPTPKSPEMTKLLDEMAITVFGRSRVLSIQSNMCVDCGKPAVDFTDALSRKEYGTSGLCQACQDAIFG